MLSNYGDAEIARSNWCEVDGFVSGVEQYWSAPGVEGLLLSKACHSHSPLNGNKHQDGSLH